MRQRRTNVNIATILSATNLNRYQMDICRKEYDGITNDPDKNSRIAACLCKTCHYLMSGIGGQAMTERECGICGKDMLFSSTNTDVLCQPCAEANSLCKHCGGDIRDRQRRKTDIK